MKKLLIFTVLLLSSSLMFAGGEQCSKKCGSGKSCNKNTAMQTVKVTDPETGKEILCNHAADVDCVVGSCPRATALAKLNDSTTGTVASADLTSNEHRHAWWKFWGSKDDDCCKKANP